MAFGYLRHGRVEGNSVGFAIVIGMVFYVGWYFNNASYKKKAVWGSQQISHVSSCAQYPVSPTINTEGHVLKSLDVDTSPKVAKFLKLVRIGRS